jgi:hypothetical protein
MNDYEYKTFKFKAMSIVNNVNTTYILKKYTSQLNKFIQSGIFLFNSYVLHCLSNNLDIILDSTIIRQCCMLFIDPNKKMGLVKQKFKKPDFTDKSENEIKELENKFANKCENIKNKGLINKKRLDTFSSCI